MSQRRADDLNWRRKAYMLLPGDDGDALFVAKIVVRQTGRCCSAVALIFDALKRSNVPDQCYVEGPLFTQGLSFESLAASTMEAFYVEDSS